MNAASGAWRRARERQRMLGIRVTTVAGLRFVKRQAERKWQRLRLRAGLDQDTYDRAVIGKFTGSLDLTTAVRHWRRHLTRALPASGDQLERIRLMLNRDGRAAIDEYVATAETLLEHRFNLLGSGPVQLGDAIDWQCDFKTGKRWDAQQFWADVPIIRGDGSDIKVPWELSRGHHLVALSQAAALSLDSRFSLEVSRQMLHWLASNPPLRGVNWSCPMDVSIRAVNWLWALGLIAEREEISDDLFADAFAALILHGRFVRANLETGTSGARHNHYIADLVGLLYLGVCLTECAESVEWRTFALRELSGEIDTQVLEDGVDYESSIPYHGLVTEMFLSSVALCRHNAVPVPHVIEARLALMLQFVSAYTKPDGLAPQIGDADDGRLHVLAPARSRDPRDHRHLLATGGWMYERQDWLRQSGPLWLEALWLGAAASVDFDTAPAEAELKSAGFPHGGFYIFRSERDHVLFACNPVGTLGIGNHKHNDLLSIHVALDGDDIVIDPGTYLYSADPVSRTRFRSTAVHSTLTVDGDEQNRFVPGELFALSPDASPEVVTCTLGAEIESITARHNGYARLSDRVTHERTVKYERTTGCVTVVDVVASAVPGATHTIRWTVPFSPDCRVRTAEAGYHVTARRAVVLVSAPPSPFTHQLDEDWVSESYGRRRRAPVVRYQWTGRLPVTLSFTISRVV